MKKIILLAVVIPAAFAVLTFAEEPALKVSDAVICKDVKDSAPVEPGSSFPSDAGKLFCFTRILGAKGEITVTHVWFLEGKQIALVPLKVGSPNWRTWSSKQISPEWVGTWKVEVRDPEDKVIHTLEFNTYKPGSADDKPTEDVPSEEKPTEEKE